MSDIFSAGKALYLKGSDYMKPSLQRVGRQIGHNWGLYLLLLPSLILLIIFSYKPMYGVVIAFKDYKNSLGIMGSPWADPLFKHFSRFFNSFQCGTTIRNTLALSLYSLLVGFPIPIILALMINQISAKRFRKGFYCCNGWLAAHLAFSFPWTTWCNLRVVWQNSTEHHG